MRWEQLFADLDSRFADMAEEDLRAESADRQRAADGALSLVQRCRGSIGTPVQVHLRAGQVHAGELRDVGPDWMLLRTSMTGEVLVRLAAVTAIDGLRRSTAQPLSLVDERFDVRLALRRIARDRAPVLVGVLDATADRRGGGVEIGGTIDRVGADFVELARHAVWEARRASAVISTVLVPIHAIDTVRTLPQG